MQPLCSSFILENANTNFEKHENHKKFKFQPWKKAIEEIPWDLILLIGGGIAVAEAFKVTNTSDYIAGFLSPLAGLPPFFAVLVIVGSVSFLTEITSNTATTTILVPILFELANQNKKHPLLYGLPVCLGANLAFMLPIATGPNAIMYGTKTFAWVL